MLSRRFKVWKRKPPPLSSYKKSVHVRIIVLSYFFFDVFLPANMSTRSSKKTFFFHNCVEHFNILSFNKEKVG